MCPITKYQANPELKVRRFNLVIFSLLLIFSGAYLCLMNSVMVRGFELQKLKLKSQILADDNRNFELQVASLKSYDNLSQKLQQLQMVAVDNIDYLSVTSALAKK